MTDFGLSGGYKDGGGLTSYFSAGTFASTQYALNIASEFFIINNISINSEKTVAISINQSVRIAKLSIWGQPILIAKKDKTYYYLSIFLFTEGLSKLSVVKAHVDVRFFVNIVLKKAITDKQYSYLVSAVLQPIWDALVKKSLRSKTCFPHDFPDAALYYPLLYDLKLFEQVQSEGKVAALIMFSNASGVLGHLFSHRFLDLQVLGWAFLDPLQFSIRLHVSPVNKFLAGLVKIFLDNGLSLVNNLPIAFYSPGRFLMFAILGKSLYFNLRLNLCGPVPCWFTVSSEFLRSRDFLSSGLANHVELLGLDILGFFEVFTNGSLKNFGSTEVVSGAAAYFPALDLSVDIAVQGLLLSTMAKLQAVALFLECVLSLCTVVLYLDSQAVIDACVSEMSLAVPNFCNQYWIERHHIFNLVRNKDFSVSWIKMKGHSGVPGNMEADLAAKAVFGSFFSLLAGMCKHFLVAESTPVSAGLGFDVVLEAMIVRINWIVTAMVWHSDSHMLTGFTSHKSSVLWTYLMKAVHRKLSVAVRKRLYDRHYPSVLCLLCGSVEFSDHSFTCTHKSGICEKILVEASAHWSVLASVSKFSASTVL
ncbi:hypothetical protein G9A89_020701 [Geosiphon pyriformis]|nr:hypothetical protein G9A89_020701 [Geosiphon pyriformis]